MRKVTFGEVRAALQRGALVHIGVNDPIEPGTRHVARACYEEAANDSNTAGTISNACVCQLDIEQYDELHALGAVETGLVDPNAS